MDAAVPSFRDSDNPIDAAAAGWLARRDRGLTASEQDEFLEWLRQDPLHRRAIARLDQTWAALDALSEWRPAHGQQPNPDLLALPRPRRNRMIPLARVALAAAAAIAVGAFIYWPASPTNPTPPIATNAVRVIPAPERITLADGTVVDLNAGGKIETAFTEERRSVRLVRGEAHFTVAKDPSRPFVVDAGELSVRAVGTAFDVHRHEAAVEVLVTEGEVLLQRRGATAESDSQSLAAGQRAVLDLRTANAGFAVTGVTPHEVERTLSWQGVRLELDSLPLSEVVAEFNLRNSQQLLVGDEETGKLRVGGTFRADNVEGFVRLIQQSFDLAVERRADGTMVLRRAR